jgi:tRNA(Ile)-lysidine synthetase-like protein
MLRSNHLSYPGALGVKLRFIPLKEQGINPLWGSLLFSGGRESLSLMSTPYRQPKEVGGRLIRTVVSSLRKAEIQLPITSYILIAISGGSDSVALAHLLLKYGRRVGTAAKMELLHVNHGWRGQASDEDESFVRKLGARWKVPVTVVQARGGKLPKGESWEKLARDARKEIYERLANEKNAIVLTGHQADDLAETVLWRILTGAAKTHGGGISVRSGVELRPFLGVRKQFLKDFLREERLPWREDATNHEGRFMRSRMRRDIMTRLEEQFPRAIEHLGRLALGAQRAAVRGVSTESVESDAELFLAATGLRVRRSHHDLIQAKLKDRTWSGELHLPEGWILKRRPPGERQK